MVINYVTIPTYYFITKLS